MKAYKCEDCGKIFFYPRETRECVGEYWGSPAYETEYTCPHCRRGYFEEVEVDDKKYKEQYLAERERYDDQMMYEYYMGF